MKYRQLLGLGNSIEECLQMEKFDQHQKKLIHNVEGCSDEQWAWVNSYYDGDKDDSWDFFENVENVYDIIYDDSGTDIFEPGYRHWGKDAKEYLKDTRLAGKAFKQMVVLYFTALLYEEAVDEIEFSEDQKQKVLDALKEIKSRIKLNEEN